MSLSKYQLDQRYSVTGRFYQVESKSKTDQPFKCREVLEIFKIDSSELKCDAIFVMMNPGGSCPLNVTEPTSLEAALLVPTKPDDTQYQLMRLMEAFGWEHLRVLNLSDVRESDSARLTVHLTRFTTDHEYNSHSVFSATRQDRLAALMTRKPNSPVFLAWGVSPKIKALAEQALSRLKTHEVSAPLGLEHPKWKGWAYYHPLPRNALAVQRWRKNAYAHIFQYMHSERLQF